MPLRTSPASIEHFLQKEASSGFQISLYSSLVASTWSKTSTILWSSGTSARILQKLPCVCLTYSLPILASSAGASDIQFSRLTRMLWGSFFVVRFSCSNQFVVCHFWTMLCSARRCRPKEGRDSPSLGSHTSLRSTRVTVTSGVSWSSLVRSFRRSDFPIPGMPLVFHKSSGWNYSHTLADWAKEIGTGTTHMIELRLELLFCFAAGIWNQEPSGKVETPLPIWGIRVSGCVCGPKATGIGTPFP